MWEEAEKSSEKAGLKPVEKEEVAMRNYSKKIAKYSLEKRKRVFLNAYCHTTNEERLRVIADAMQDAFGDDTISRWIWDDVVGGAKWSLLEARGVPCSRDAFRIYKAKFFCVLDKKIGATFYGSKDSTMNPKGSDDK